MNRYQFTISLRVRHPSIDPSRITEALGQQPKRAWQAGALRATAKGDPLAGTYDDTYWTSGSLRRGEWKPGSRSPETLYGAIEALLSDLAGHKRFFQDIRSGGGSVVFSVGWFLDGDTGGVFDHDLLRRMGDFGIDLMLFLYPPGQNAAEPELPQP